MSKPEQGDRVGADEPQPGETWETVDGATVTLGALLPCGKCHDGHDGVGIWMRPGADCDGTELRRRLSPAPRSGEAQFKREGMATSKND